jgi:hypothetical protein
MAAQLHPMADQREATALHLWLLMFAAAARLPCACREVTAGCFPNCSLVLVLLEEASLGSCAAQRHVIHAAPEFAGLPKVSSLPLGALPSVETACKERHVIFKSDVAKGAAG